MKNSKRDSACHIPKAVAPKAHVPKTSHSSDDTFMNIVFKYGELHMGDRGSRDKGKKEKQKKAQLSPKEKRKLKKDKKNK